MFGFTSQRDGSAVPSQSFDLALFSDKLCFLRKTYRVMRRGVKLLFADIVGMTLLLLVNWQPALKLNPVTARIGKEG
jgi:hypothetical protein